MAYKTACADDSEDHGVVVTAGGRATQHTVEKYVKRQDAPEKISGNFQCFSFVRLCRWLCGDSKPEPDPSAEAVVRRAIRQPHQH